MKTAFIIAVLSLSISCAGKTGTQITKEPLPGKIIQSQSVNAKEDLNSFSGRYIGGYIGFEGCGYYLKFRNAQKQIMTFRSKDNPEYAFFITSKDSLLPVQNRELFSKIFIVYYTKSTEIDPRGKTVKINNYIDSDIQEN